MTTVLRIGIVTVSIGLVMLGDIVRGQSDSIPRHQQLAVRLHGLHAAAKITGSFVGPVDFHNEVVAMDLETLIHDSTVILVGQIGDNRCRLSADERRITTDYNVTVLETLKGTVAVGDSVIVSLPGGKVVFEDGTWAELLPNEYRMPQMGERYVLFLAPSRYNPAADVQSLAGPSG